MKGIIGTLLSSLFPEQESISNENTLKEYREMLLYYAIDEEKKAEYIIKNIKYTFDYIENSFGIVNQLTANYNSKKILASTDTFLKKIRENAIMIDSIINTITEISSYSDWLCIHSINPIKFDINYKKCSPDTANKFECCINEINSILADNYILLKQVLKNSANLILMHECVLKHHQSILLIIEKELKIIKSIIEVNKYGQYPDRSIKNISEYVDQFRKVQASSERLGYLHNTYSPHSDYRVKENLSYSIVNMNEIKKMKDELGIATRKLSNNHSRLFILRDALHSVNNYRNKVISEA